MKDSIAREGFNRSGHNPPLQSDSTKSKQGPPIQKKNKPSTQLKHKNEDKVTHPKEDPINKFHSLKEAQRPATIQKKKNEEGELQLKKDEGFLEPIQQKEQDEKIQLKETLQTQPNNTGLPDNLKSGIENLSGFDMNDVKVHYNSDKPSQLQAHAFAQGTDIHIASGQEKHLPHEAWHVVQQKQGRVQPTMQMKSKVNVNDDIGLEEEADVMGLKAMKSSVLFSPAELSYGSINTPVVQGAFTYTASVVLDREGAEKKEAKDYKLEGINLPAKSRPPTQYGNKQMAHSVSWTLLKKSYETVKDKTLDVFIDDYLKKDWADLTQQESLGKIKDSQNLFQSYLNKYTDTYFDDLKNEKMSFLQWYGKVQTAITDYFVALQLAPLSTHTGFTQKLIDDGEGVKESNPSSHGEPAANEFFKALEAAGGIGKSPAEVTKHAKAYWDPGIGMVNGLNDRAHIDLLLKKYEKSFQRAYPLTWANYKTDIKSEVSEKSQKEVDKVSSILKSSKKKAAVSKVKKDETEENEEENDSGGFQAKINLTENLGAGIASTADAFEIKEYDIKQIALPNDRPVTKYGIAGQKSHTVSWTLVLQNLKMLGKETKLKKFLEQLLLKWISLSSQDWDGMIASNLISSSDIKRDVTTATIERYNKENAERLNELKSKIQPNIANLAKAIAGYSRNDLEWASFVQETVADYVVVYQSSPLTSYKAESTPKGHGESDANLWFNEMENDEDEKMDDDWIKKFRNDLFDKKKSKNPVKSAWKGEPEDWDKAKIIVLKIKDDDELEESEKDQLKEMLIVHFGKKYLDVGWGAVKKNGNLSLDYSPAHFAKILAEWEETLKEAYPETWIKYKGIFERFSENIKLSDGLISEQARVKAKDPDSLGEDATMKSWIKKERNNREYLRGLVSIKSGDTSLDPDSTEYNKAKNEYNLGQNDALNSLPKFISDNSGYSQGYDDFMEGYEEAQKSPDSPVQAGHNSGYNCGYNEYRNGYLSAEASLSPTTPNGSNAFKTAYNDYIRGYQDSSSQQGVIRTTNVSRSYNLGYDHFYYGYINGRNNNGVAIFITPAYRKGYIQGSVVTGGSGDAGSKRQKII